MSVRDSAPAVGPGGGDQVGADPTGHQRLGTFCGEHLECLGQTLVVKVLPGPDQPTAVCRLRGCTPGRQRPAPWPARRRRAVRRARPGSARRGGPSTAPEPPPSTTAADRIGDATRRCPTGSRAPPRSGRPPRRGPRRRRTRSRCRSRGVPRCRPGRAPRRRSPGSAPRPVAASIDRGETAAAQPAEHGLGGATRQDHRDRGVDRRAARGQHAPTGQCGVRVTGGDRGGERGHDWQG